MERDAVCGAQVAPERLPAKVAVSVRAGSRWWSSTDESPWGIFGTSGRNSPGAPVLDPETVERIMVCFGSRASSGWLSS